MNTFNALGFEFAISNYSFIMLWETVRAHVTFFLDIKMSLEITCKE